MVVASCRNPELQCRSVHWHTTPPVLVVTSAGCAAEWTRGMPAGSRLRHTAKSLHGALCARGPRDVRLFLRRPRFIGGPTGLEPNWHVRASGGDAEQPV